MLQVIVDKGLTAALLALAGHRFGHHHKQILPGKKRRHRQELPSDTVRFALPVARLSGFPPRLRTLPTGLQLAATIMALDNAQSLGNPPVRGTPSGATKRIVKL